MRIELSALRPGVVGVEREPVLVGAPHEQDSGIRYAIEASGTECHRIRFGNRGVERLIVPALPLHHWVGVDVVGLELTGFVLHPPLADPVGHTEPPMTVMPRM